MKTLKLSHQAPMLPVHNIDLTLDFYAHNLGFENIWKWDDPPSVASAKRDDLTMLFTFDPAKSIQVSGLEIMLFLSGINELAEEYQNRSLPFAAPLEQKAWGLWEFCILDINGYYLRFAEHLPT